MKEQDEVFGKCDACEKPIFFGNAMVSFTREIAQDWLEDEEDSEINVIDAVTKQQFCASCGNLYVARTDGLMDNKPQPPWAEEDSPEAYMHCDGCGRPILYGNALVQFMRQTEQVDWTPEHPEGIITVIDAKPMLTFCARCGNDAIIRLEEMPPLEWQ